MAKYGTFADHVAIHAVSKVVPCVIHIVHADAPDIVFGAAGPTLD